MFGSLSFFYILATCVAIVAAQPIGPQKAAKSCYRIEDFSTERFLQEINKGYEDDFKANALFYSAGMSEAARKMAKELDGITIWEVWPSEYYKTSQKTWNPMRCIHHNPASRQKFFENMSRAYALKAHEGAMVLHSNANYEQPPHDGIWGTIEEPVLRNTTGPIKWIMKVKEDISKPEGSFEVWERAKGDFTQWVIGIEGPLKEWLRALGLAKPEADHTRLELRLRRNGARGHSVAVEDLSFFDRNISW